MGELVFHVDFGVVWGVGLPHFPDDFQPSLAQASQGLCMTFSPFPQRVIILRGPGGLSPAFISKEIHRVAQVFVATSSDIHFVDLPGLVAHRCRARHALQALRVFVKRAITADLAEQTRPELRSGPWQRAEKVAVGMTLKKGLDALAIDIKLALEHAELPAARHCQQAFGRDKGGIAFPLPGVFKSRDALLAGLGAIEPVAVEELFPLAPACLFQRPGVREGFDESPCARIDPVVKGFQGGGIVFVQGLLELVDEGRALLNEGDFVPAEDAQFGQDRVCGPEGPPTVSIHTQRVGQSPSVVTIRFVSAAALALPVAFGIHRIDRIEAYAAFQELLNRRAEVGLDGNPQLGPCSNLLFPEPPSGRAVIDAEVGDDLALEIDDDDVVMVFGPVETGVMSECLMWVHAFGVGCCLDGQRLATTAGRAGRESFASLCSIRPLGGSLRTGRCSTLNRRAVSEAGPCHVRGVAAVGRNRRQQVITNRVFVGGKVIHNRRRRALTRGPIRRLMNNFGKATSGASRRAAKPSDGGGGAPSAPAFLPASSCGLLPWRRLLGTVTFPGRLVSERLMGLPVVVVGKPFLQCDFQISHIFVRPEVNALVFDRPPEPFDEHVVHPAPFPIHTHPGTAPFHRGDPCTACELAALIGVEDLRCPSCRFQCLAQGFHAERAVQCVGELPRKAPPAFSSP